MVKKRQKMIYLDDELIEWYEKKYPKRSFSSTINQLLKNFLYIEIDENSENFERELRKIEEKILELKQKSSFIRAKIEEIENKRETEKLKLEKLAEKERLELFKCMICGNQTKEGNRVQLRNRYLDTSCFNSASAKQINNLIKIIEGDNNE